jgi:VanZ family protein
MTDGRRAALLATLVVGLSALALVVKFPAQPLIFVELNNAAHAPVFGALAIVWLQILSRYSAFGRWQRYIAAFALSVAIGGLIELIQPAFDRGSESLDLVTDALGAVAGLALIAAVELRKKVLLLIAVAALAPVVWPIIQYAIAYEIRAREFPTLLGNDSLAERYFIHTREIELSRVPLPPRWRQQDDSLSLRIRVRGSLYPGIAHREPEPDWRPYSRLMLDVTNPDALPLTLTMRVHDRAHKHHVADRFQRTFTVTAFERQVISFPLAEIAAGPIDRDLDLSCIAGVIVGNGAQSDQVGREYYLTRLWLE